MHLFVLVKKRQSFGDQKKNHYRDTLFFITPLQKALYCFVMFILRCSENTSLSLLPRISYQTHCSLVMGILQLSDSDDH